jgi:molybdate transport system regulatory protein
MNFNYKVWIVNENNEKFFGTGPVMLLKKTSELGSLNRAAKELVMSYSKAFSIIKNAENELSVKLLIGHSGGLYGGGSSITEDAVELIKKYDEFNYRCGEAIKEIYNEIFWDERENTSRDYRQQKVRKDNGAE